MQGTLGALATRTRQYLLPLRPTEPTAGALPESSRVSVKEPDGVAGELAAYGKVVLGLSPYTVLVMLSNGTSPPTLAPASGWVTTR